MANWVYNDISFPKKYKNLIVNENGNVDFNLIAPIPGKILESRWANESKNDLSCFIIVYMTNKFRKPITNKLIYEIYQFINEHIPYAFWIECSNVTPEQGIFLILAKLNQIYTEESYNNYDFYYRNGKELYELCKKCGTYNSYNWMYMNWGCKANALETQLVAETRVSYIYRFKTPWNVPDEWLKKLSKKGIVFKDEWEEEQGERGIISNTKNKGFVIKDLKPIKWGE